MNIKDVDKNFNAESVLTEKFPNLKFIDCHTAPMEIFGLAQKGENGVFCRLSAELLPELNGCLNWLSYHTAGARICFRTDSPYIALRAVSREEFMMRHMPLTGSNGFDIYTLRGDDSYFVKVIAPDLPATLKFEDIVSFNTNDKLDSDGCRDVVINFPLYNGVTSVYVGLDCNSKILPPTPYKIGNIVYYGSSITQGGCASRPGNSYQAVISRRLDCDYTNLGFSGSAKGEKEIVDYIAGLDMTAMVIDYDFNAPSVEHLAKTHMPIYRAVRQKHPNIPIIMVTNPVYDLDGRAADSQARKEVILSTYNTAVSEGDKMVSFVDGRSFFGDKERGSYTVDNLHPTDLGFIKMADVIGEAIKKYFK